MRRILVLGATGMLGHTLFQELSRYSDADTWGTIRNSADTRFFGPAAARLVAGVDAVDGDSLVTALRRIRPDVVINCVGVIKQLKAANDPLVTLPINALLPHRLSRLCEAQGARLIHISTDCVFAGTRGMYVETDAPDATDLYGMSKFLGEVRDAAHALTLRLSMIGHELQSARSLVDWFLAQPGPVEGYHKAIFSGLPTIEIARVVRDVVLPRPELHGLYHLSAAPIDKCRLLELVATAYGKDIVIRPSDRVVIDRSLDGERFSRATGYKAPDWPSLIRMMRDAHDNAAREGHSNV